MKAEVFLKLTRNEKAISIMVSKKDELNRLYNELLDALLVFHDEKAFEAVDQAIVANAISTMDAHDKSIGNCFAVIPQEDGYGGE